MQKQMNVASPPNAEWIPLTRSMLLMLSRKQLLGWSLVLFLITIFLTWLGYLLTVDFLDNATGGFTTAAPAADTIWGWIKHKGWVVGSWLFLVVSRIVAFYFAFLLAYTLTTPGYAFLSSAAEKLHAGEAFAADGGFSISGFLLDIFEGMKIAIFGLLVTIIAFLVNFIPGIGQVAVVLLYTFYSALMFIDYPASRRRWSLGRKLDWLRSHSSIALRIGLLPALLSMIPLVNIFAMSLLFPLLTIHATLNFSAVELTPKLPDASRGGQYYGTRD
jgi:CysZ protein